MTDDQRTAFIAWRATLSREEQEECDYIASLQGGDHATAYLAVRLMRAERVMAEMAQRSIWKDGAKAIGTAAAIIAAAFTGYRTGQ